MDAGLLPVKALTDAKGRLAPHFGDAGRHEIARALLHDAIELCRACDFLTWWVVTADEYAAALARDAGLEILPDRGDGLNPALLDASAAVARFDADSLTIVPSDVPLAWEGDIRDLIDTGAASDVVLVPAESGGGTNALFMRPPGLISPHFGPSSLRSHLAAAEASSLRCSILALSRLALDIDTIEDVDRFLERAVHPSQTRDVLTALRGTAQTDGGSGRGDSS